MLLVKKIEQKEREKNPNRYNNIYFIRLKILIKRKKL